MIKATYSDAFFASVTAIATVVTIILQVNYYIQV
jgi:energy-coupling factor transport system permease protein